MGYAGGLCAFLSVEMCRFRRCPSLSVAVLFFDKKPVNKKLGSTRENWLKMRNFKGKYPMRIFTNFRNT